MSEHGELIQAYVAAEEVVSALAAIGLSAEESEVAAQAVRRGRAQWVVDNIAHELGRRACVLRSRKAELATELNQVEQDIRAINTILVPGKNGDRTEEFVGLFDKQLSYDARLRLMRTQAPFVLRMVGEPQTPNHRRLTPSPSVVSWIRLSQDSLESKYGGRIVSAMLRGGRIIDMAIRNRELEKSELKEAVAVDATADGPQLAVYEPETFLDYLIGTDNGFGHKSMVAIMCLADFQAE